MRRKRTPALRTLTALGPLALCACVSAQAAQPTAGPTATLEPARPAPSASGASLASPDARLSTFGDLVDAGNARITAGALAPREPCLLASRGDAFVLAAELMPALSELAPPAVDLDPQLAIARGPVRALTAWGQAGAVAPQLAVAAFTALPPQSLRAAVVAVVLTDQGAYLRYGGGGAGDADGPIAVEAVVARLLSRPEAAQAVLYVTAESATSLAQLAALLRLLPHGRMIALAQVLPAGTELPALSAAEPPARACPDGLPEPQAGRAEGDLDAQAVVAALGPLRESASACLSNAAGAARAGGRLALALRVAESGAIEDACLLEDGIADAALAACVLTSARALRLPAPAPAGFVDVHVPLSLTPLSEPAPAPLCD